MGLVKGMVIGMGALIIVGFIVVAVTLVVRMQGVSAPTEAYRATLSLPQGAEIVESNVADGLMLLRLTSEGGGAWLMVVDAGTGQEKGRITLVPEGP